MDALDAERIRYEAQYANQMLTNPLFERLNESIRKELHQAWEDGGNGTEQREEIWRQLHAMNDYIEGLRNYLYSAQQLGEDL